MNTLSSPIVALNPAGNSEDGSRAFALQYTALMLTILAFVVGAFAGPKVQTQPIVEQISIIEKDINKVISQDLVVLEYDDIFTAPHLGSKVNDSVDALKYMLLNHDVRLSVIVGITQNETSSSSEEFLLSSAMDRSRSLTQYFMNAGVPLNAIEIFAADYYTSHQANITIQKLNNTDDYSLMEEVNGG